MAVYINKLRINNEMRECVKQMFTQGDMKRFLSAQTL